MFHSKHVAHNMGFHKFILLNVKAARDCLIFSLNYFCSINVYSAHFIGSFGWLYEDVEMSQRVEFDSTRVTLHI